MKKTEDKKEYMYENWCDKDKKWVTTRCKKYKSSESWESSRTCLACIHEGKYRRVQKDGN